MRWRRIGWRRALCLALVGLVVAPPLLYLGAAVALGALALNEEFVATPDERGGVPVFLRTNGIHADLVLPALGAHYWTREFPRAVVIDLRRVASVADYDWIAFGWGDRAFYLNTPAWRDVRLATAWHALRGQGPAAMHVEYLRRPEDYDGTMLWLSEDQYLDLVAYVRAGFALDAQGRPERIEHPGYFGTDAFYAATGHYSAVLTSNEWVRRALAHAGVRVPRWAPFDVALYWQADRIAER